MDTLIWLDIFKWILLLIALLIFNLFLQQASDEWKSEKGEALGGAGGDGSPSEDDFSSDTSFKEYERRMQEAAAARKRDKIREILEKDPQVGKMLSEMAGKGSLDLEKLDDPGLDEFAKKIDDDLLDLFHAAVSKIPIELDLDSAKIHMEEVPTGGQHTDFARLKSLDQLHQVRPEELAFPKRLRRMRIATGHMQRIRRFELVPVRKLLYILRDRSGSMTNLMPNGAKRDTWARGIVLKYSLQALAGKTQFYFRDFDAEVKKLMKVLRAEDVPPFIKYLKSHPAPEDAGTDILKSIKRAVKDIEAAVEEGISSADILLLSDGSDSSVADPEVVRTELKGIRLHVIMIGAENESLKKVATTYIVV